MLDAITSVVLLAAAWIVLYKNVVSPRELASSPPIPSAAVDVTDSQVRGAVDSKAVLIIFSDFECPYCRQFTRDVLPSLERNFVDTSQVAVAFWQFPLRIHPHAMPAAVASLCAGQQGRFWQMHDKLFAVQSWSDTTIADVAPALGLDLRAFSECLRSDSVRRTVDGAIAQAQGWGIRGTPSFFIGRRTSATRVDVLASASGVMTPDKFIDFMNSTLSKMIPRRFGFLSNLLP
jgi:protein-disulfide isomerase